MEEFCKKLPKIELHAHLTGSIRPETLHEIWKDAKQKDPSLDLGDPVEVLGKAREEMSATVYVQIESIYPGNHVTDKGVSFFPLFSKYIYRLSNSAAYITQCTRAVLSDFAADGVTYLELRTIPRASTDLSREAYVSLVLDVIATQPADQKPASTYLVLGVDRKDSAAEAASLVELAVQFKDRGVVGVDLAGNPARNADKVVQHAEAYRRAKEAGLGVTLHFAELEPSASEEELAALLSYLPDRLGHVIRVPDWAKEEIIKRKIGLEICLTSNVSGKLIEGGYADHHYAYWQDKGCPIAICTDDVGIFGSTVTNEWLMLITHFNLSKHEAIKVCKSGIDCIFGSEADKQRLRKELEEYEATL